MKNAWGFVKIAELTLSLSHELHNLFQKDSQTTSNMKPMGDQALKITSRQTSAICANPNCNHTVIRHKSQEMENIYCSRNCFYAGRTAITDKALPFVKENIATMSRRNIAAATGIGYDALNVRIINWVKRGLLDVTIRGCDVKATPVSEFFTFSNEYEMIVG